jgi:GGDEF domain-containing protein
MQQLFAKVARETLRATDIIGRLGGEELVALLPSAAAEAAIAAERVRQRLPSPASSATAGASLRR